MILPQSNLAVGEKSGTDQCPQSTLEIGKRQYSNVLKARVHSGVRGVKFQTCYKLTEYSKGKHL